MATLLPLVCGCAAQLLRARELQLCGSFQYRCSKRLGAKRDQLLLLLVLLTRLTDEKLPRTRRMALFWQKCGAVSGGSIDLAQGQSY